MCNVRSEAADREDGNVAIVDGHHLKAVQVVSPSTPRSDPVTVKSPHSPRVRFSQFVFMDGTILHGRHLKAEQVRRGDNLKRFKYFCLKAKARIWP